MPPKHIMSGDYGGFGCASPSLAQLLPAPGVTCLQWVPQKSSAEPPLGQSDHSLSLLTPALATTYPYSDSEQFLILSLAYKQNYAICVVFFLLSSFFSSVKNYQGSSMCQNQDSVSLKGTIIFPFMDITHLLTHCSVG